MEKLQRLRMSYDEFLTLPDDVRAEYVDGEVVVTPPARLHHQKASARLVTLLLNTFPDLTVVAEAGLSTARTRKRIPDVMVFAKADGDQVFAQETPVLVVEIVSPSTRNEDLLRKTVEYQRAGIGQYWILDRDATTLTVLANNGEGWDPLLELDETSPRGTVVVEAYGEVGLDLTDLLR